MSKAQENGMTPSTIQPRDAAAGTKDAQPPGAPALLDSQELLRGQNAVAIAHNGSLYRLQTTRQGKLILTK
jgi:hemin uptake protein HemP